MNKRLSKAFGILFLLIELAIVPNAIKLMLGQHISELSPLRIAALAMTVGAIALCILMSYSSMSECGNYPLHTFLFELMVFLCCILPLTDLLTEVLEEEGRRGLNMLVNTVYYLIAANIAYILLRYAFLIIGTEDKPVLRKIRRAAAILMILGNIAVFLNIPFGFYFTISETGAYQSAPTYWTAFIAPAVTLAATAAAAAREMRPGRQKRAFLYFWIFALLAAVLQALKPELSPQYTGFTLSIIVIYVGIQSELDSSDVAVPERKDS